MVGSTQMSFTNKGAAVEGEFMAHIMRLEDGQTKMQSQMHNLGAELSVKHAENVRRIGRLEHSIDGNGRPGLKEDLSFVKGGIRFLMWAVGIEAPFLVGLLIYLISKR